MVIKPPTKIYLKESPVHGYGVFCSEEIEYDEIIEICPFLTFPHKRHEKLPFFHNYSFCWPKSTSWINHAMVMGYGSYYNHNKVPNTTWITDENDFVYIFKSLRKITVGEELFVDYGNGVVF